MSEFGRLRGIVYEQGTRSGNNMKKSVVSRNKPEQIVELLRQ